MHHLKLLGDWFDMVRDGDSCSVCMSYDYCDHFIHDIAASDSSYTSGSLSSSPVSRSSTPTSMSSSPVIKNKQVLVIRNPRPATCERCGRDNHVTNQCKARYHLDGDVLSCDRCFRVCHSTSVCSARKRRSDYALLCTFRLSTGTLCCNLVSSHGRCSSHKRSKR